MFDVLIIGGGAAGLYTALSLPSDLQVGLITKEALSASASDWAQGGIAAAINTEDSPQLHAQDTLSAGAGLCDPDAVDLLVRQASQQVQSLLEMGIAFDRHEQHLAFTLEAAHSRPRVLHAADATGKALIKTLTHQVLQRANIEVIAATFTLDLWLEHGECQGVSLVTQNTLTWVPAHSVILATGGGGQVFAQTTNPALSTGDGIAMAWRVGAQLRDLEFVQFHPTALTRPGAPRFLISEAVRGEGAHLLDAHGHRFMFDYHPLGELAPRDVVSRGIFTHLENCCTRGEAEATEAVWLDLSPIAPAQIRRRFPKIIQVCRRWGIDVFSQPIPVLPAAHYWMGGIATDLQGQTSIPRLYAVGEVASTGVHGANRLASNSLLECLVFASQVAAEVTANSSKTPMAAKPSASLRVNSWPGQSSPVLELRQKLPQLVWQSAGICRDGATLEAAIAQVQSWRHQFEQIPLSQYLAQRQPTAAMEFSHTQAEAEIRLWAETQNLLDIGYLILTSAHFRTESRGGHYRRDYPQVDPHWQVHTLVRKDTWQRSEPIPTPA
ncbi:L-aspartate oxidase [Synechococcales cyanobacterium C]|uniref:L-aspartate oxidase n=1 Tax=Petrachloros mirabilis ULC683 TaxID=2781853 RepID=A0A8K1ZVL6_9CYAN|nr:L-aspartate oxidase [Petrachloros mirabilis]NCJ06030.1 L-aspartate oxidase [Petrachloros mirabilis ULC683]